jgi:hypothetical protein
MSGNGNFGGFFIGSIIGWIIIFLFCMLLYGCPKYNVWTAKIKVQEQKLVGEQELERARQNRKIIVEEAEANVIKDSLEAIGEVHRAHGVAEAMEIEDGKLTDRYIKYLFVRNINNMKEGEKIYIPTEAGLPILEAK